MVCTFCQKETFFSQKAATECHYIQLEYLNISYILLIRCFMSVSIWVRWGGLVLLFSIHQLTISHHVHSLRKSQKIHHISPMVQRNILSYFEKRKTPDASWLNKWKHPNIEINWPSSAPPWFGTKNLLPDIIYRLYTYIWIIFLFVHQIQSIIFIRISHILQIIEFHLVHKEH